MTDERIQRMLDRHGDPAGSPAPADGHDVELYRLVFDALDEGAALPMRECDPDALVAAVLPPVPRHSITEVVFVPVALLLLAAVTLPMAAGPLAQGLSTTLRLLARLDLPVFGLLVAAALAATSRVLEARPRRTA